MCAGNSWSSRAKRDAECTEAAKRQMNKEIYVCQL